MIKFTSKPFSVPGFPLLESALNLFRVAVENVVRDVNRCPFITGSLIEDITFVAFQDQKVYHKLGRAPKGWIVTTATGDYLSIFENERTDKYVEFHPEKPFTASFWFF